MTTDCDRWQAMTLAAAREQLLPHFHGKPISQATAYRWVKHGVRAGDGTLVRLGAMKFGRNLVTTVEDVRQFHEELAQRSGKVDTLR
jgi:hypothetical protein